mgnify:CR=1 FL=1
MNKTFTIQSVFAIVIACMFTGIGMSALVLSVGITLSPESDLLFLTLISILTGQGVMVIPALLYVQSSHASFYNIFRIKPIPLSIVFPVIVLSLGTIIISDEIDRIIGMFFPIQNYIENLEDMVHFHSPLYTLILITATVILAPLSEEILFRGFLQNFLENHWKDITKAVLVTSLLFATVHLNPGWIIQIYLMGIILGYLAWKTGSVFPGFILHALNNAIALCSQNFSGDVESIYIWKNHVSPFFILLAIFLVYTGYRSINSHLLEATK